MFDITKDDLKKSQLCPVGLHLFTVVEVEDEYENAKGTTVQKVNFESEKGYQISYWFNDAMLSSVIEFISAADNINLDMETFAGMQVNLKDYVGKKFAGNVVHEKRKDGGNKVNAVIENFYSADKVPF